MPLRSRGDREHGAHDGTIAAPGLPPWKLNNGCRAQAQINAAA
jgi:hypothetical protein